MRYENASGDKPIDIADADLGPELDLDVTRPCPQLDFRVHVECSRILGRPHVDGAVGQRVVLHLPAGQTCISMTINRFEVNTAESRITLKAAQSYPLS